MMSLVVRYLQVGIKIYIKSDKIKNYFMTYEQKHRNRPYPARLSDSWPVFVHPHPLFHYCFNRNNQQKPFKELMHSLTHGSTDLMSSYSPSGGMKLMLRSESNLLRRTHWWKVQSSMAMDCFPLPEERRRGERGKNIIHTLHTPVTSHLSHQNITTGSPSITKTNTNTYINE